VKAHPSQYFIKYLLVAQEDISLESINSTLTMYGMIGIDELYLGMLRLDVADIPEDFRPWDKRHRPSTTWLRAKRIFGLTHPDPSLREMQKKIIARPATRLKVEGMLLGCVDAREISFRLKKLKIAVSDVAIQNYKHYFWNTEEMGLEDWAGYFFEDKEGESGTGRTALSTNVYNAALHAGPEVALYRLGVRREIDSKKIMVEVQAELYHTFLEIKSLPLSEGKVKMLTHTSRALARIDERIQAGDTALQDVLKKFEKFKVLTDDKEVPTLAALAPTGSISSKSRSEILTTRDS
jgi:hypothetical protein